MMEIDTIYSRPDHDVLEKIVSGRSLRIASPFYSPGLMRSIFKSNIEKLTLITRLPGQYTSPTSFIENDPKPILELLDKFNCNLKVYALPSLHAKLYTRDNKVWVGSSNFSHNGFSGKPEIIIQFSDRANEWLKIFNEYKKLASPVNISDLLKLQNWIDRNLTKIKNSDRNISHSNSEASHPALSFEDFVDWLSHSDQPHSNIRQHLVDSVQGKHYMSGHVPYGFHGAMTFLRQNSDLFEVLGKVENQKIPESVLSRFAFFIEENGDEYRGPRGGVWRNYLSTKLGGKQTRGGAGDTIAKKCLILVPAYLKHREQFNFQ